MSIPFTATPDSISIFLDGRMRVVQRTHMNFASVASTIKNISRGTAQSDALDHLRQLVDIPSFIARVTEGRVTVSDDEVRFDGQPLRTYATKRLLEMLREGFDVRPLARFLDRLERNPYALEAAKDELYRFLERGNMPLTEDGCFLAFKRVREDYRSIHTGPEETPFYSIPGTRVEFPKERLNIHERGQTCSSSGLHVCSFDYLTHFGNDVGNKVVVVKCAPEELWSVPRAEDTKCQMVAYEVLREVPYDEVKHLFEGVSWTDAQGGAYEGGSEDDPRDCDEGEDCHDEPCCRDEAEEHEPDYGDDEYRTDAERASDREIEERAVRDAAAHGYPVARGDLKDELQARLKAQNKAFKQRHGQSLTKIEKMVRKHGQNETARRTGIPRATIQRWMAARAGD